MSEEMVYLTDEILRRTVANQTEDEFDSHDLIFALMTDFPHDYVRQLNECLDHEDPFVKLHTRIGRRLASKELNNALKQLHRKRRSRNCRCKDDECEVWAKVQSVAN